MSQELNAALIQHFAKRSIRNLEVAKDLASPPKWVLEEAADNLKTCLQRLATLEAKQV
jgi:hypothetical protein